MLGQAGPGEISLTELIERPATLPASDSAKIAIDPTDPCIFQLSGGTTGVPKLIPRTHNDYAYNSKTAAQVCGVTGDSVLLLVLPIAHNLPLGLPGHPGLLLQRRQGRAERQHPARGHVSRWSRSTASRISRWCRRC